MTESKSHHQLGLLSAIDDPIAQLRQAMTPIDADPAEGLARVHLRCPRCDWRQVIRLSARRTERSRLEGLLPRVPVRHWVFSLGRSAQSRLVDRPRLQTRVARACVSAVFDWLRRAARRSGIAGPLRCGAVSAIHRVDAALEPNVHVHALVLDGVYADVDAESVFHPLAPPRRRDLRRMLAELRPVLASLLARAPAVVSDRGDAGLSKPRVQHRVVAGPPIEPVPAATDGALGQRSGELDVRAGPPIAGDDGPVRARLCRYVEREPFDLRRLSRAAGGRLRYRLHRPFADGTTHVEFSVDALAQRLGSLAGGGWRPSMSFHGVVAPAAAPRPSTGHQLSLVDAAPPQRARSAPLSCPRCRGTLDVIGVEWVDRAA